MSRITISVALAIGAFACGPAATDEPLGDDAPKITDEVADVVEMGGSTRALILLADDEDEAPEITLDDMRALEEVITHRRSKHFARLSSFRRSIEKVREHVEIERTFENIPYAIVTVRTPEGLAALESSPDAVRVYEDRGYPPLLAQSLGLIRQPVAAQAGKIGAGTTVAVLDTGAIYTRPELGSCTSPGVPAGCKVNHAQDFAPSDNSLDDDGHGTNVSAVVLGVAPGAKVAALDVFRADGYAWTSEILAAIDWTIANRARLNIVSMNMSLGGGGATAACSSSPFAAAIANAKNAGILSAIASGNDGFRDRIAEPACVPAAVSVGAVYDANLGAIQFSRCSDPTTAADRVTCFSNSASFLSVLAPGAFVSAGGFTMAGTSQAAPHVAGAIAVLRAARPTDTVAQTLARLQDHGTRVTDPRNGVTRPRIDVGASATAQAPVADTSPPTGSVVIAAGAAYTRVTSVALTLSAADPSGVAAMCISNTPTCTTFVPYAASKAWVLAAGDGGKRVYVRYRDSRGNVSAVPVTDTIVLDTTPPANGVLNGVAGARQVSLSWSGFADVSGLNGYRLVFSTTTPPASCYTGTLLYQGTGTLFVHSARTPGVANHYRVCAVDRALNTSTGAAISRTATGP